ncbi:MAG: endonuclease [Synergistaceae bacterium]|nr:endonuclease [Synergistaceae bacterium]
MLAGIDPGRWKIGFALAEEGKLLFSAIVPADEKEKLVKALINCDWQSLSGWRAEGSAEEAAGLRPEAIYIGSGTAAKEFLRDFPLPHFVVDEYGSTLEAREIYWRLHRPRGIVRLLPLSLRTPPRNIDDLAAYVILLRGASAS